LSQRYTSLRDGTPVVEIDATSGNEEHTLTSGFTPGRQYIVERVDGSANTVTVSAENGDTLNGTPNGSITIPPREAVTLDRLDAAWRTVGFGGGEQGSGASITDASVTAAKLASDVATTLAVDPAFTVRYARSYAKAVPRLGVALPSLAANPPTISYSASNTTTTISNSRVTPISTAAYMCAQALIATGTDQAGNSYYRANAQTGNELPTWFAAFQTDAPTFEIVYQGSLNPTYRLVVDGYAVTLATVQASGATSGQQHRMLVTFPDRRFRDIRLESELFFPSSIVTTAIDTVTPRKRKRRIGFMGDSYLQNGGVNGIAPVAAALTDCDYVINSSGGTGYVNAQGGVGGKQKYLDRLPNLLAADLDYLVTCGGINDTTGTLGAEVAAYLTLAKQTLPADRIIMIGPWTPPSQSGSANTSKRDLISAAVTAAGCTFIDNVTTPWQTGTGTASATTGDGNSDLYMGVDTTHPTADGYTYLGARLGVELAALIGV
jgi:lysophospholipase L1-like esterase